MSVSFSREASAFLKCGTWRLFFVNPYFTTASAFYPSRWNQCFVTSLVHYQPFSPAPQPIHGQFSTFSQRPTFFSTQSDPSKPLSTEKKVDDDVSDGKLSLVQRFKNAYKVYGKVLIIVHGVTSVAWLGLFYIIAYSGIDVISVLRGVTFLDWAIEPMVTRGLGLWATALILYKLNAPFRYLTTLAVTRFVVRLLRAHGMVPPLAEEDRLRNLARQGVQLSRKRIIQSSNRMRARMRTVSYKRQPKRPFM